MTWSEAGFTLGKQLPPDEVDCRHSTYTVYPNLDISKLSIGTHRVNDADPKYSDLSNNFIVFNNRTGGQNFKGVSNKAIDFKAKLVHIASSNFTSRKFFGSNEKS